MTAPRILVAGIGNIFLGDDAFGVEVVKQLSNRKLPECVEVVDFGIRGFDLVYALLDGYDLTILVDATPRGGLPGTLYKIEPDLKEIENLDCEAMAVETHGMNPLKVFSMVKSLGGEFRRLILVGCEPADLGELEEGRLGLTDAVRASIDGAVTMVEKLIQEAIEQSAANCAIESREQKGRPI